MKRIATILLSCAVIIFMLLSTATADEVKGKVVDKATNTPLAGANVFLLGTTMGSATDKDGNFILNNIPPGVYELRVNFIGYEPFIIKNFRVSSSSSKMDIELSPDALTSDEVVVTAVKVSRANLETVEPVNVISTGELEKRNAVTITEVLRNEPGVSINHGPTPDRENIEIRGMSNERVVKQIDGAKMNLQGGHSGGTHLNAEDIQRIEIVRGPASALYGSSAIGGVVSIITKEPRNLLRPGQTTGVNLRTAYNSLTEEMSENVQVFGIHNKLDWKLNYTRRDGKYLRDGSDGKLEAFSETYGNNVSAMGIFRMNGSNNLKLNYEFYEYVPTYSPGKLSPDEYYSGRGGIEYRYDYTQRSINRNLLQGKFTHLGKSRLMTKLELTAYYQKSEIVDDDELHSIRMSSNQWTVTKEEDGRFLDTFGGELKMHGSFNTGSVQHMLTYGAEIMLDYYEQSVKGNENLYADAGFTSQISSEPILEARTPDVDYYLYSGYLQDEISIGDKFILIPGVRLDSYKADADKNTPGYNSDLITKDESDAVSVSPKFGTVYKLNSRNSLTGSVGRGFRVPDKGELFYAFQMGSYFAFIPNPELEPEKSWNYELGYKHNSSRFTGSANVFYASYDDFIASVSTGVISPGSKMPDRQYVNFDKVKMWGAELYGRYNVTRELSFISGFTFHRGESEETDRRIEGLYKPKVTATVQYSPTLYDRPVNIFLNCRYVGKMDYYTDDGEGNDILDDYPDHTLIDLGIGGTLFSRVNVNMNINNLFDRDYVEYSNFINRSPGRYASISLSLKY